MNERLKELAEKTGVTMLNVLSCYEEEIKCFAELVRQDEREACARLCDDVDTPDGWSTSSLSASIRARGNHESLFDN